MSRRANGIVGRPCATPYEQHRDYVLAVLSRRCAWLDRDERAEAFHDAYVVVLTKERDGTLDLDSMPPEQVRAFLTQTAIHKGLDEGKRAGRKRTAPLDDVELTEPDTGRPPDDLVLAGLESARVREIIAELPARRRDIVALRYLRDRTPEEIQRTLGLTERVYRRELERAVRSIRERYASVEDGSFCDSRRSMILALVRGIAGPTRARAAREHLATCPSCAAWAARLRDEGAGGPSVATSRGPIRERALPGAGFFVRERRDEVAHDVEAARWAAGRSADPRLRRAAGR